MCPNRANVAISVKSDLFNNIYQIIHLDALCNECGNCETFCPYQGAPYKDKFTLFWDEKDFYDSQNNGFLLVSENGTVDFKVRLNSQISKVKFDENGAYEGLLPAEIAKLIWTVYKDYNYLINVT